jgi:hypothetical protein
VYATQRNKGDNSMNKLQRNAKKIVRANSMYKLIMVNDKGRFACVVDKDQEKLNWFEINVGYHIRNMVNNGDFGDYRNCSISCIVSSNFENGATIVYSIVAQNPHSTAPEYHSLITYTATIINIPFETETETDMDTKSVAKYLCNL